MYLLSAEVWQITGIYGYCVNDRTKNSTISQMMARMMHFHNCKIFYCVWNVHEYCNLQYTCRMICIANCRTYRVVTRTLHWTNIAHSRWYVLYSSHLKGHLVRPRLQQRLKKVSRNQYMQKTRLIGVRYEQGDYVVQVQDENLPRQTKTLRRGSLSLVVRVNTVLTNNTNMASLSRSMTRPAVSARSGGTWQEGRWVDIAGKFSNPSSNDLGLFGFVGHIRSWWKQFANIPCGMHIRYYQSRTEETRMSCYRKLGFPNVPETIISLLAHRCWGLYIPVSTK